MKFEQLKKIMLLSKDESDCKVSYILFKALESINANKNFGYEVKIDIGDIWR